MDTALDGLDELGDVGMAGVEGRVGVDDADDGTGEGIFAVSKGLDENFSEKEGEVGIAVRCETLTKTGGVAGDGGVKVVVSGDWPLPLTFGVL